MKLESTVDDRGGEESREGERREGGEGANKRKSVETQHQTQLALKGVNNPVVTHSRFKT